MIENTEEKAVIRALWDYFMQCPVMAAGKINVDYLPRSAAAPTWNIPLILLPQHAS